MSRTYKVYYLDKKEIKKIYVFLGDRYITSEDGEKINISELFESEPRNKVFETIFKEDELENIIKNKDNIEIKFCKEQLHIDDSIEISKRKIIKEFDEDIAFEEIYLFSKKYEMIDSIDLYQKLTQGDKLVLTNIRLSQYLLNVSDVNIDRLPEKDVYDFDDILSLNISEKKHLVNIPIGQQFVATENVYPYTVNPFDVDIYDPFLEKFAQNITTTNNNSLLMTTGEIKENIIYLCLAKDVITNAKDNGLPEETTIKIYFPLLYIANDITSLSELMAKRQTLISNTKRKFSEKVIKQIEHVDLLYDIYNNRTTELKYKANGIKKIQFTIHPTFNFKLPLDIVFKLIHVSKEIPLIKYNPSTRQEKIYKLHCENISVNRKKIPYLNKALIFKLSKKIARTPRSVAVYIEKIFGTGSTGKIPIICEFEGNGNITVNATFNQALSEQEINTAIRDTINPIIVTVQNFLEQSGYSINLFENFLADNVEIMDINYESIIEIDRPINIKKIMGCVSTAFIVSEDDFSKGIKMRFTRVSNFKEMEAMEAAVIGFIQKGILDRNDIVEELIEAFKISHEEANEKLGEILSQLDFEKTTYKNRKLKIKSNPGFLTTMNAVSYTKNIAINVEGINDINYLTTIPIYLDSIIRLTQDISTTRVTSAKINTICKGKIQSVEPISKDIVPKAQQELGPVNVHVNIVNEELVVEEKEIEEFSEEEQDDLFDKLLARRGDDDDEDDEEELSGGGPKKKKALGNSDDDEKDSELSSLSNDDDADENSDLESESGNKKKGKLDIDITGKALTHPNPFIERLEQRDPKLFLTRDEGRFKAYSRVCQSNMRRQPVILTDDEKTRIDKYHKGSYTEAVKYGSNPDNQYWYICPRYWSLKYNVSLTEEQVKSGKYGKVIDRKAKTVPPDATIYEFAAPEQHFNTKGEYTPHYPGFLKNTSHPENLCVPCCFNSWNKPEQIRRRNVCMNGEEDKPKKQKKKKEIEEASEEEREKVEDEEKAESEEKEEEKDEKDEKGKKAIVKKTYKQDKTKLDDYIKGPEKFPLEAGRWGYLPLAIQKFLRTDNSKCYVSKTNTSLKPNHECLLRYGVENNELQSFIASIASVYSQVINVPSVSITDMKNVIISGIDIDDFITYQNGSLVEIFDNQEIDVVVKNYKKSALYKTIDIKNKTEVDFFKRVIASYETFIGYLRDDTIQIDHKYLWDIVSRKNPKIFPDGLNLIILEMPNNDITDNVNLLCPSNHYSSEIFNANKPCLILLKINEYYEPIYSLEIQETKQGSRWEIKRTFSFKNRSLMSNLRHTIEIIKASYSKNCIPLNSLPKTIYEFKTNIIVSELKKHLDSLEYEIINQVMNFNSKIIGLMVKNPDRDTCFVPCYPSASLPDIEIVFMNNDKLWTTFENTYTFLKNLSKDSNKKIPCLPKIKVLEDGLIVGLLTETNQFISIEEPEEDVIYRDMSVITDGTNYIIPDITSTTDNNVDNERIQSINRIRLESNFYNVFRNTIRILLGQFRNRKIRETIEQIIKNPYLLYKNKLKQIIERLITLTSRYISFAKYNNSVLNRMTEVTNCLSSLGDCDSKQYCIKEEGNCRLRIPKNNLINGLDNEMGYFVKMADELVRYNRIKSFIFEPKAFLPLSDVKYNLKDNEIILLQSLLTQDYFDDLVPLVENKYVANTAYDMAIPQANSKNIPYDNEIDVLLNNKLKPMIMDELKCPTSGKVIGGKLKSMFPKNTVEIVFETELNPLCSFEIMVQIIMDHNKDKEDIYVTKASLKEDLIEFYRQYDEYYDVIADILTKQGKRFATQIFEIKQNMTDLILSQDYYATNLDIWALATKYKVPIIFLSGTTLIENDKDILIANSDDSDKYYFIKTPGINPSKIPIYKLIVVHESLSVPISSLPIQSQEKIRMAERESFSIDSFIKERNLIERKQRKPVKKLKKFKIAQEEKEPIVKKLKKKFKLVDE